MLNTYVPALELLNVVPGRLTLLIATLSLTVTVNATTCVCDEVFNSTVVSLALILQVGSWSSALLILIVISCVTELLALSVTVAVNVSVLSPKL
mgnify:CR=1 FL=1